VRNAIIWCDPEERSAKQRAFGFVRPRGFDWLTSNPPLTNFTLTKLLWVRETERKAGPGSRTSCAQRLRAFASRETSHRCADASAHFAGCRQSEWSIEFSARQASIRLCFRALRVIPNVREGVGCSAEATGLRVELPWSRAGDQAPERWHGIARAGAVSATIGTPASSLLPRIVRTRSRGQAAHLLPCDPGRWHVMVSRRRGIVFALVSRSFRRHDR